MKFSKLIMAIMMFTATSTAVYAKEIKNIPHNPVPFKDWLGKFKSEALSKGISKETLKIAFHDITLNPKLIKFDRRQPEFTITFAEYIEKRVSKKRIERGHKKLIEHNELFETASHKVNVQKRFIAAIWGMETNYGGYTGNYNIVRSLMTLAYDMRRPKFFRKELFTALTILDQKHISYKDMTGSWAGAMGQGQFMPTSFLAYAYDLDGDGKKNIWTDYGDSFASIGHYLKTHGWTEGATWGRAVTLPKNVDALLLKVKATHKPKSCKSAMRKHSAEFTLEEWQKMGVRSIWGKDLPKGALKNTKATLLMPDGKKGPAYLTYKNFKTILTYNCSNYYGLAVSLLSDKLK